MRRLPISPAWLTAALTAAIAVTAVACSLAAPTHALLPSPRGYPAGAVLLGVAVLFLLAESAQALIEFRNQAYSFSLTGVPFLLGLLYCPPHQLLAARLVTALVIFALQRSAVLKAGFNSATYVLDLAIVAGLTHWLLDGRSPALDLRTAAVVWLVPLVTEAGLSSLVLLVIRINAPGARARLSQVLAPMLVVLTVNTVLALAAAALLENGSLGVVLLLLLAASTAAAYRGYLTLRHRHQSLQVVQRFIEQGAEAGALQEQAALMLAEIREMVRARAVELTLAGEEGGPGVRIVSQAEDLPGGVHDRPYAEGLPPRPIVVTARTADDRYRAWLRVHGVGDAAVVPVDRLGTTGMLVAVDRLGDQLTFTRDDLALMQALAGHLAVALRNTQLVTALRHDARHDRLTGLANRAVLDERLAETLGRDPAPGVLLLDLDRFKEVNDALGHHVGNLLLQVVAERLEEHLAGTGATAVRLGGDEFAVLVPDGGTAPELARSLAARLREPVDLGDATVSSEASIGVALGDPGGGTGDDLVRRADVAMYAAKAAGVDVSLYSADLDAGRGERLALLSDLHLALERDELRLHYQPKFDLAQGRVTGVEALLRWDHPTQGRIPPDVFIPLAESTGMIDKLTSVVLGQALRQSRAWSDEGLDLVVAVNLSTRNLLNPGLAGEVTAALAAHGVAPGRLILEITESSVMGDAERTLPVLERLAGAGITLSLDDFGTGYSSLSYLQRLPVSEVKIDRSFVIGLAGGDETSTVLVTSIVNLGAGLGLRIVAEGVEDAGTLERLRGLGCDVVQGWHTGRPVPAAELSAGLRSSAAAAR